MAEITIRFRHNAATGRRELVVHLESDSDVLGHEHEGDHRRVVEQLIGQPLDAETDVVIERIEKTAVDPQATTPTDVVAANKMPQHG